MDFSAGQSPLELRGLVCGRSQPEVRHRAEVDARDAQLVHGGVRVGAGGHDDVADLDLRGEGAGGAHPNDPLHPELAEQLGGVDREGGLPHSRAHDAQWPAVHGPGEAQHPAHVSDQAGILHEELGNAPSPLGVAGHEDGWGEVSRLCGNMRGGHGGVLSEW